MKHLIPLTLLPISGCLAASANKELALTADNVGKMVLNDLWPVAWMFLGTMALLAGVGAFWIWLHSYQRQKPIYERKKNGIS